MLSHLQKTGKKSIFFENKKTRVANETFTIVKNAAIYALETLGVGHSERTYESVIQNYLYDRRVPTKRQARYFTTVDSNIIETGILDIEINHSVLLELKVGCDVISKDHKIQIQRYLRCAKQNKPGMDLVAAVFLFTRQGQLRIYKITYTYK